MIAEPERLIVDMFAELYCLLNIPFQAHAEIKTNKNGMTGECKQIHVL